MIVRILATPKQLKKKKRVMKMTGWAFWDFGGFQLGGNVFIWKGIGKGFMREKDSGARKGLHNLYSPNSTPRIPTGLSRPCHHTYSADRYSAITAPLPTQSEPLHRSITHAISIDPPRSPTSPSSPFVSCISHLPLGLLPFDWQLNKLPSLSLWS